MSNQELTAVLAVFGGLAVVVIALTIFGLRMRRSGDADALAMRAATVAAECRDILPGPDFLWTVWQDTDKAAAMKTLVRDSQDAIVSTITVPTAPMGGALRHFDFDGRRYEIRKKSIMSNRTCLREAGRPEILLSADHTVPSTNFFRGDGESEMFRLPITSAFSRFRPILQGEQEIGRMVLGLKGHSFSAVLGLPAGHCSTLERLFVLASL